MNKHKDRTQTITQTHKKITNIEKHTQKQKLKNDNIHIKHL